MVETIPSTADLFVRIHQQIDIDAPLKIAFDALLEQAGPGNTLMDGSAMPMTLEAWPGGRWFRDTGNKTGHFWGHVQVIKPPTLLEITGPLFMSYAAVNHVQHKLAEHADGTRLTLTHLSMGNIDPQHRSSMTMGWDYILKQIKKRAQK